MIINVKDSEKQVEIWLTNSESRDETLREKLKEQYSKFKQKKYRVFVFCSGQGDLIGNTVGLICHNRDITAKKNRDNER